jgi:hypothetical protein
MVQLILQHSSKAQNKIRVDDFIILNNIREK